MQVGENAHLARRRTTGGGPTTRARNLHRFVLGFACANRKERTMNVQNIREHLPVIASCGQRIGTVDRVEGFSIKLTKSAPAAHGEHRYIPLAWVASVAE